MSNDLRDHLRDQLAHWSIGSEAVGIDDACDMADGLMPIMYGFAAQVLRAAAEEQRNEADQVPWDDEGTHADGHRCAADFLDRRAEVLEPNT